MITVRIVTENEDGSADCEVSVTPEGMAILLQYGFNTVLKEAIENTKLEATKDEFV